MQSVCTYINNENMLTYKWVYVKTYIHEQRNNLKEYTQILINIGNPYIVKTEEKEKDAFTFYFIHVLFYFQGAQLQYLVKLLQRCFVLWPWRVWNISKNTVTKVWIMYQVTVSLSMSQLKPLRAEITCLGCYLYLIMCYFLVYLC